MKKFVCWLFVLLAVVAGPLLSDAQARTVRLFLIGNSFSQNATRYLPQLAKEGGHELIIGRAEKGGCSLKTHWEGVEAGEVNQEDPKAKIYSKGQTLRQLLSVGTWDIVTIQQYSLHSSNVETYRPYAEKLRDYIKKLQPGAEVVVHQTWAYRNDARAFGQLTGGKPAQSDQEMWEASRAAYHAIAGELGVRVIPSGDAFWRVRSNPQWSYQRDVTYDFKAPVYPTLPVQSNSLHVGFKWDGQTKLTSDYNHANNAGCYLGAATWYGFLFGESPEKLTFVPPGVPAAFATYLRQAAWQTVKETPQAHKKADP